MPEMLIRSQIKQQDLKGAEDIFKSGQIELTNDKAKISLETVAKCLSKYEKILKTTGIISEALTTIAMSTQSAKAVTDSASLISHYEKSPAAAGRIADQLGLIAYITVSEKAVTDAIKEIYKTTTPEGAVKKAEEITAQARSNVR